MTDYINNVNQADLREPVSLLELCIGLQVRGSLQEVRCLKGSCTGVWWGGGGVREPSLGWVMTQEAPWSAGESPLIPAIAYCY